MARFVCEVERKMESASGWNAMQSTGFEAGEAATERRGVGDCADGFEGSKAERGGSSKTLIYATRPADQLNLNHTAGVTRTCLLSPPTARKRSNPSTSKAVIALNPVCNVGAFMPNLPCWSYGRTTSEPAVEPWSARA